MSFRVIMKPYEPKFRNERLIDAKYRKLVGLLPCVITKTMVNIEAAHIRYADLVNFTKPLTGMAIKPDDCWVLPLSQEMHRTGPHAQHNTGNEEGWWQDHGFCPLSLCQKLYNDGNYNNRYNRKS
ncbi:MAG: hypothetical protein HRU28_05480 [Rhizobiales bacterium]|nr:hypothetical protein [Hyphomicrobiales bacterium]